MSESPQVKQHLISIVTNLVHELSQDMPNHLNADGGALCPHKTKKNLGP